MIIVKIKAIFAEYGIILGLIILGTMASVQNLFFYLRFDFHFFLILMAAPFVLFVRNKGSYSLKYALFSIICLATYPFLKVQSFFFLGYMFFLLFAIESQLGRLNTLPLILVILISPFSSFVFEQLGFPIRLHLTEASANMLNLINLDARPVGNIIYLGEEAFSVDPECMGLKMVTTSFLITLVFIAYFEKMSRNVLSLLNQFVIMLVVSVLIIFANLTRIILLIVSRSNPDTASHEIIGLLCLVVYVVVPVYFIVKFYSKRFERNFEERNTITTRSILRIPLSILILALLTYLNFNRDEYRNNEKDPLAEQIILHGYEKDTVEGNVMKFENEDALIYVKPSSNFYGADHTPFICWKGSGYSFNHESVEEIGNFKVYMAKLSSEDEVLYTAWWYDNGVHKTSSQLDWRWRMATGENAFRLINVTCTNKEKLLVKTKYLLERNLFESLAVSS